MHWGVCMHDTEQGVGERSGDEELVATIIRQSQHVLGARDCRSIIQMGLGTMGTFETK